MEFPYVKFTRNGNRVHMLLNICPPYFNTLQSGFQKQNIPHIHSLKVNCTVKKKRDIKMQPLIFYLFSFCLRIAPTLLGIDSTNFTVTSGEIFYHTSSKVGLRTKTLVMLLFRIFLLFWCIIQQPSLNYFSCIFGSVYVLPNGF